MAQSRLAEFDGLRAIAILVVVLFHYFQTYTTTLPYGGSMLPLAVYGEMGVYLFFVISGFVISCSLRSAPGVWEFLVKRFFRLWPALAVCSVLTFAIMHAIDTPFTAKERVSAWSFLPSLTFSDREWWEAAFGIDRYVDRVYWTLAIEVRFYVWTIIICTLVGVARFAETMALFLLLSQFVTAGFAYFGSQGMSDVLYDVFISGSAHYFAAGIVCARIFERGPDQRSLALLAWAFCVSMSLSEDNWEMAFNGLIFAIVLICTWKMPMARVFAARPLVWIGVSSYAIYLLHNQIGAAVLSLLPEGLSNMQYLLAIAAVFAGILALSRLVYLYVEQPALAFMRRHIVQPKPVAAALPAE